MILVCKMERETNLKILQKDDYFNTKIHIILKLTNVKDIISLMIRKIMEKITLYQKDGSGWYFKEVVRLEIHTVDYKPMKASTYIPLPEFIMRKKAIINMKNKDDKCFLWSVLRYLHKIENYEERLTDLKKQENDLNFKGIDFPVKVKDITTFENQNPDLPGVNVFSLNEDNKIYPLRLNEKDCQKTIDLFLFSKDEKMH